MIKDKLTNIIKEYDADISMLVKNFTKNEIIFSYNEKNIFPSASIIKVPIMIEGLNKANKLEIPLLTNIKIKDSDNVDFSIIAEQNLTECTFLELITWMIISSDNTATNVIIDLLGLENINDTIKNIGMKNTRLQRKMMDFQSIKEGKDNITTLSDMLKIMEGLYNGEIIDKELSKRAIDIMKNQRSNNMLKRYILEDVSLANKTGELDNLNNDIGIFYTKSADYFIGISANNLKNSQEGNQIIGKLSKVVYDTIAL